MTQRHDWIDGLCASSPRRIAACGVIAVGVIAAVGCSSDEQRRTSSDTGGWRVGGSGDAGSADTRGASPPDVPDGDAPDASPRVVVKTLDLAGTTWRRHVAGTDSTRTVAWAKFRDDGTVVKRLENRSNGQRGSVEGTQQGTWSVESDGDLRIEYSGDEGLALNFEHPRVGVRLPPEQAWFEVPEMEAGWRMRWSPYVYEAKDRNVRRTFDGRVRIAFPSVSGRTFGPSLRYLEVALDFDAPIDTQREGNDCSVELRVAARAEYGEESPVCEVTRELERACDIQAVENSSLRKVSLGYGTDIEEAHEAWRNVEPNTPEDSEVCREATRIFHTRFVPLFYVDDSSPSTLFGAFPPGPDAEQPGRWVRHRTDEPMPEPTDDS